MRAFLLALCLCVAACGPAQRAAQVPQPIVAKAPSWDGNQQNSGIILRDKNGFVCSPHFLARYDAMLATYGAHFAPALKPGDRTGITPEGANWRFDAAAMSRFIKLNQLRKIEAAP